MKTIWFQDIKNKEEQEQFKNNVLSSKIVLDKLKQIVYTKVKMGERTTSNDYDSPSWAYRQADKIGYLRALKEIEDILTVDEH
jgi:hypothetical protein